MILTEEQQRWCAQHLLTVGFDDDDEDKVQYVHVCDFEGGDGDEPRPERIEHITRKKRVKLRRARNGWARRLARTGQQDAYEIREQYRGELYETHGPHKQSPFCDGCLKWIGRRWHQSSGYALRSLHYCKDCGVSGHATSDRERRQAAFEKRRQPLAFPPFRRRALCRSPRLWFADQHSSRWPALDETEDSATRQSRSDHWANITCIDCLRILRARGCPGVEEGAK